jgi:hypothetical protein
MIGYTFLFALSWFSLYRCQICSSDTELTLMDENTVVFSVDKSTHKTTAVELHADKCNCKSIESAEITDLKTMVANLTMQLATLTTKSKSSGTSQNELGISVSLVSIIKLFIDFVFIIQ